METRIYSVGDHSGTTYLVRAVSKAAAIRHVASKHFYAGVAKQEELVNAIKRGVEIEDIKPEQLDMVTP